MALVLRADPKLATEAGEALAYEAKTVLRLESDAVLIAASKARAPASTVPGALGIFYLRATAAGPEVAGAWPRAAIGAPNAAAPGFGVTNAFGQWPVVVARSQEVRSGVVCERTQLIELRPTGPVVSAPFVSGFDAREAEGAAGRSWVGRLRDLGVPISPEDCRIVSESAVVVWEMVKRGMGVGVMMREVGEQTPGVVRLLPELRPIPVPIWLVTHQELQSRPSIRLVQAIMAQELART